MTWFKRWGYRDGTNWVHTNVGIVLCPKDLLESLLKSWSLTIYVHEPLIQVKKIFYSGLPLKPKEIFPRDELTNHVKSSLVNPNNQTKCLQAEFYNWIDIFQWLILRTKLGLSRVWHSLNKTMAWHQYKYFLTSYFHARLRQLWWRKYFKRDEESDKNLRNIKTLNSNVILNNEMPHLYRIKYG